MIRTDPLLEEYLRNGRLKIVVGDATSLEDVRRLFEDGGRKVDVVISSVGMSPVSLHVSTTTTTTTMGSLHCPLPKTAHV